MKDTSKEELKALAEECNSIPLQVNDKYYLINSHWYRIWADFIGLSKTYDDTHGHNHPGVIDNRSLLTQPNSTLKSDLIEDTDFKIIHEKLWNRLKEEYGVSSELVCASFEY
jgi:DUSP domain